MDKSCMTCTHRYSHTTGICVRFPPVLMLEQTVNGVQTIWDWPYVSDNICSEYQEHHAECTVAGMFSRVCHNCKHQTEITFDTGICTRFMTIPGNTDAILGPQVFPTSRCSEFQARNDRQLLTLDQIEELLQNEENDRD